MKIKDTIPTGCEEAPGHILDVFDGSAWFTQDGRVTSEWKERGVWMTHEAAERAADRFFRSQATIQVKI